MKREQVQLSFDDAIAARFPDGGKRAIAQGPDPVGEYVRIFCRLNNLT